jgi:hypothetical protein
MAGIRGFIAGGETIHTEQLIRVETKPSWQPE